jgi:hypothetical protein
MPDHFEAGGHVLQHLTLVLPDAAEQAATTSRAGADRLVCDGLAWQMCRQRSSGRVAALPRLCQRVGVSLRVLFGRCTRLRLGSPRRLGASGKSLLLSVVRQNRRFWRARMPWWCINLATRLRPIRRPSPQSAACTRGLPYQWSTTRCQQ